MVGANQKESIRGRKVLTETQEPVVVIPEAESNVKIITAISRKKTNWGESWEKEKLVELVSFISEETSTFLLYDLELERFDELKVLNMYDPVERIDEYTKEENPKPRSKNQNLFLKRQNQRMNWLNTTLLFSVGCRQNSGGLALFNS